MSNKIITQNYLLTQLNVSRETFAKLENYVELLLKWNKRINLISRSSEERVWTRHILDSAQLIPYIDGNKSVMDIGSGSGLPGLVLSILGIQNIHLVDSDMRKCVFLQEAKKISQNNLTIHNCLFAETNIANIDVVTARAFSNIEKLLVAIYKKLPEIGEVVLLKGKTWQEEIGAAQQNWHFDHEVRPSITDDLARIIRLTNIRPRR